MNPRISHARHAGRHAHHAGFRLLAVIVLLTFGLVDAAAVALPAVALSVNELAAFGIAFVLMAGGLLFTVWQLED